MIKKGIREALLSFTSAVESKDFQRAGKLLLEAMAVDEAAAIKEIKKTGVVRLSINWKHSCTIAQALQYVVSTAGNLSDESVLYLQSMMCLHAISDFYRIAMNRLVWAFKTDKERAIKSMLVLLDAHFLLSSHLRTSSARSTGSYLMGLMKELCDYTSEELAEGFSLAFSVYAKTVGQPSTNDIKPMLRKEVSRYRNLLLDATKLSLIREIEAKIEMYDYHLYRKADYRLFLDPPSVHFEQCVQLGYIHDSYQEIAEVVKILDEDTVKNTMRLDRFSSQLASSCIRLLDFPKRYTLHIPMVSVLRELLSMPGYMQEEMLPLIVWAEKLMCDVELLLDFELKQNVAVRQLIRVHRFFNFLRAMLATVLTPDDREIKKDPMVFFNSLVVCMEKSILLDHVQAVVAIEEAESIIEFLTWKSDSGEYFDIQYQPIVNLSSGLYWVPLHLLCLSNVIRNSFQLTRKRLFDDGVDEPLTRELLEVLQKISSQVVGEKKVSVGAKRYEIDAAAIFGDYLLVFECKRPLSPGGNRELRTTWEHINKGAEQLSRIEERTSKPQGVSKLCQELGFNMAATKLITCIVLGNRMFAGFRKSGHPVRTIGELRRFLYEGFVVINNSKIRLWKSSKLEPDDVVNYLAHDSFHRVCLGSMTPKVEIVNIGKWSINCSTYGLDQEKFETDLTSLSHGLQNPPQ